MHYTKLVIREIQEEVEGFKTFSFQGGHGLSYQPGQYLTFLVDGQPSGPRRSYSITSTPFLDEPLTIGVKRVENGSFSRWLIDKAQPGDELTTTGSGGFFVLPENISSYQRVIFFAAGSGITPVFPLVKTILHLYPQLPVYLFYSNDSREKTVFYHSLNKLNQLYPGNFHLKYFFSNSPDLKTARLNRELLSSLLKQLGISDPGKTLFYICGPEAYMRMCTYCLQEENVPAENIRRENFFIERIPPPKITPPDVLQHKLTLVLGQKEYIFDVQYPETILQTAKKQGLVLPYSCETGRCGNCVARCVQGKVWMSYNEVLTQKDLDQGLTLTCVGYPVGGDVVLKMEV